MAAMELRRRQQAQKTVYGFYRPNGEYGGELVKCLQETNGEYVEVDLPPTVTLAEKLEPFLTKQKRFKVLYGGRGSTKSIGVASIATSQAKDYGEKTLCLREVQNTIEDSVHALLVDQIKAHYWTGFDITDKHIRLDGEDVFKFRGLSRNSDGVKSMFGFKRGWVEEAQGTSRNSLEDLTPTIREAGSELWFTLNPKSSADPISQRFLVPYERDLLANGYYEDD
jgi:phage terminase large subunit